MILLTPVLLLLALSGCFTEVVEDFTETCPQFFVNPGGIRSPPTVFAGNNYKQICQVRYNNYEYATFYDTNNKIPVYSAYRFEGLEHCERIEKWYIEPQLEDSSGSWRMERENKSVQYNHQAVNADYAKSGYNKGHLAPVYHAESQSCADATFTLTNLARTRVMSSRLVANCNDQSHMDPDFLQGFNTHR
ncbi:endonuclease domain-containing 1 protein-like [Hoplias malabaricus]|uniref:endonuclease domain-containing 1 protein-like n=1 Tax=Hoplias malabaricus TaxID=27720 RepID=UPI00346280A8